MDKELFDALGFEKHCPELAEIGRDLSDVLTEDDARRLRIESQTHKQLKAYILQEHGEDMYETAAGKFELHVRFTEYVLHRCVLRGYHLDDELVTLYNQR